MAKARQYVAAAAPAVVAIAMSKSAPMDGARVVDSNGVCCVEPTYYFVARVIGQLSPVIVAFCVMWIIAICL